MYKPNSSIYKLAFEGPHLGGLEVKAKSTTLGKLGEFMSLNVNTADKATYETPFRYLATRIVEWNVVHPEVESDLEAIAGGNAHMECAKCGLVEDDPLPATFEALMCLDPGFVVTIIQAWMEAIASIEVPKGFSMNGGRQTVNELPTLDLETLPIPNLTK